MFFKTRTSIILMDHSIKPVQFVVGCLVFVLTLMVMGTLSLQKHIQEGEATFKQQISFEVIAKGQSMEDFEHALLTLQQHLNATAGILGTSLMTEPSLNHHALLIAKTTPQRPISKEQILENLKNIYPHITLQSHALAEESLVKTNRGLLMLAFVLMICVGGAVILSISLVTRTGLSMQRSVIDILRLIGAPNSFIARQFQWFSLRMSFFASLVGVFFACIGGISVYLASGILGFMEKINVFHTDAVLLALAIPFFIASLSFIVARIEVIRTLIKLDYQPT